MGQHAEVHWCDSRLILFFILLFVSMGSKAPGDVYYSNVLSNAGFELGSSSSNITDWIRVGNAFRKSDITHSGSFALCTWGSYWAGNWSGSGADQLHPSKDGQIWEASVWAMTTNGVFGSAYGSVLIKCYDVNSQLIGSVTSPMRIKEGIAINQWMQLKVKIVIDKYTAYISATPMFIQSPAWEDGVVWFDDCALYQVPANYVEFSGRTWQVNDETFLPPYETCHSTNCVSVDTNGWLHLEVKNIDGIWYCPSLEVTESLGFGEYRWYMGSPLEQVDSNLVAGLFIYALEDEYGTNQVEIDIEVTHAVAGSQTNCLLYTVQPYTIPGNGYQHPLETTNLLTTQRFFWRPDRIDWQTYYGHTADPSPEQFLAGWRFNRRGIPIETNERTMMNLWLLFTNAPADTQCLEMVIHDFVFVPFDGFVLTDEFDDQARSNVWVTVGDESSVSEADGRLTVTPTSASDPTGYQTAEYIHRNERGTRYVFSARLAAVDITTPCAGDDVMPWMSLSVATNQTPFESPSAIILQGRFDRETDRLVFGLYVKTNAPNSLGTLYYEGSLSNVSSRLASGGLDLRVELDPVSYCFDLRDTQGNPVEAALISGSASGLHQLGECVNNAFWMIGAQKSDDLCIASVSWARAEIGIADQSEPFNVVPAVSSEGTVVFSMPGYFDTRCTVYRSTNLTEAFVPVASNIPVRSASMVITNAQETASGAYYRIKVE